MKTNLFASILSLGVAALLFTSASASADMPPKEDLETVNQFIELMGGYLDVSEQWLKLVEDEDMVLFLVAEGIAEIYEEKGDPTGAIAELEKMAEQHKSRPRVVTAIRFKLRDLYKDAGQLDKALKELHVILATHGK